MLSLVNYGSSGSENEISDEEEVLEPKGHQNGKAEEEELEVNNEIHRKLPAPSSHKTSAQVIEEDDDEFLHKKAVPTVAPPKKEKVKIFIPKMSDFKEDDDDVKPAKMPSASNRKPGLLNMLPRPANSYAPAQKSSIPVNIPSEPSSSVPSTANSSTSQPPKKVGLIPYALMAHNKSGVNKKAQKKKADDSDSDDDDGNDPTSFFSFGSKDEDLPQVNEDEIKAMVAKQTAKLEQRETETEEPEVPEELENRQGEFNQHQDAEIDQEAMKALLGGNRAKRSKLNDIQIIDLSAEQVMPNKNEWLRRSLAGETSFIPTGNMVEKGPSSLAKRKHQISYLSMRAETNEQELEAMWAANRQTKRESKSKYGF